MDFTSETIEALHQQYTGKSFFRLLQAFKALQMHDFVFDLRAGEATYHHQSGASLKRDLLLPPLTIPQKSDGQKALIVLRNHQAGNTDFMTFIQEIAQAGVYKWVSDCEEMTCTYYDLKDDVLITEVIKGDDSGD